MVTFRLLSSLFDYLANLLRYRAPELLLSQPYTKPVDLWAVGCIMGELIDGQPLFPGENEIDQLYLIQKVIGPLTDHQKEFFRKSQRFLGQKFPEIEKPETLERHYLGKISQKALSFMKSVLKMEPNERLTCEEALNHAYFSEDGEGGEEGGGRKEGGRTINKEKRAFLE